MTHWQPYEQWYGETWFPVFRGEDARGDYDECDYGDDYMDQYLSAHWWGFWSLPPPLSVRIFVGGVELRDPRAPPA